MLKPTASTHLLRGLTTGVREDRRGEGRPLRGVDVQGRRRRRPRHRLRRRPGTNLVHGSSRERRPAASAIDSFPNRIRSGEYPFPLSPPIAPHTHTHTHTHTPAPGRAHSSSVRPVAHPPRLVPTSVVAVSDAMQRVHRDAKIITLNGVVSGDYADDITSTDDVSPHG
jgi:hypothetical protein